MYMMRNKKEVIMTNKKTEALMSTLKNEEVAVIHSAFEDTPRTVALVKVDKSLSVTEKLEIAFTKTNSINDAWWSNEDVTPMFPDGACRSTSTGDMVLVGNEKYKCEMGGWSKI
jgi:hypothetical protein